PVREFLIGGTRAGGAMGESTDAPQGFETEAAPGPGSCRAENLATFAALDLGTNNCRMLVARPYSHTAAAPCGLGGEAEAPKQALVAGEFRVIDSFSRITRLGEGLSRSGTLSVEAMDRTVDALKRCADKMERRRVTASRHVATEACRRATNCD